MKKGQLNITTCSVSPDITYFLTEPTIKYQDTNMSEIISRVKIVSLLLFLYFNCCSDINYFQNKITMVTSYSSRENVKMGEITNS